MLLVRPASTDVLRCKVVGQKQACNSSYTLQNLNGRYVLLCVAHARLIAFACLHCMFCPCLLALCIVLPPWAFADVWTTSIPVWCTCDALIMIKVYNYF